MATTTTNIGLTKPSGSDKVQIAQLNLNSDIIDEKIGPVGGTSLQDQITAINGTLSSMGTKMLNIPLFNGDCNGITETCTVYVGNSAAGGPGPWSIMHTVVFDSDNAIVQYAFSVPNGTMKMRSKTGNPASWTAWTSQNLQTMVVSSVSNLQAALLAKAQTMGSEGIENIKIIFNGSNEGVFTNGNYYCGWLAINSKGSDYLYFSGVIKGLWGSDTIEFTYSNGGWSFHKLSVIRYVDATVPVGTTAGAYKVGTFASLGIPSTATLLSAQCVNTTSSVCHVTGTSVYGSDIYVYVVETVAVSNGLVRIIYQI